MSLFEPSFRHMREVLIYYFNVKKSAIEAHQMLTIAYGEDVITLETCLEWFRCFENGDFEGKTRYRAIKHEVFEDTELAALIAQDPSQNQKDLARALGVTQQDISKRTKAMGLIRKKEHWERQSTWPEILDMSVKPNFQQDKSPNTSSDNMEKHPDEKNFSKPPNKSPKS